MKLKPIKASILRTLKPLTVTCIQKRHAHVYFTADTKNCQQWFVYSQPRAVQRFDATFGVRRACIPEGISTPLIIPDSYYCHFSTRYLL